MNVRLPLRVRRTYRGWYLSGRCRYLKVKWLHRDVRAIRAGLWQVQVGRVLMRCSWTLARTGRAGAVDSGDRV